MEARDVHWTITDTCTSPDGRFLLYSTISPIVNLVNVEGTRDVVHSIANVTEIHESLNFSRGESDYRRWGIWSLDWSSDSKARFARFACVFCMLVVNACFACLFCMLVLMLGRLACFVSFLSLSRQTGAALCTLCPEVAGFKDDLAASV